MIPNLSIVLRVVVCFFKPLQEWLAGFPNFLTRFFVHIFLADVSPPLRDNVLLQDIVLVQRHEDFRNSRDQVGIRQPDQPLDASQQRFLMLLRGDHLYKAISVEVKDPNIEHTFANREL